MVPDIPFYILTGFGDKELVISLFEKGLDGYLDKPFRNEEFLKVVSEAIEKRQQQLAEENELFLLFLDDAEQNLSEIDYKVNTINENPEAIKDIKRLLHTLKGSSSFIKGCDQVSELSHRAEDMIKTFLDKGSSLSDEAASALLEAVDFLRAMLSEFKDNKKKRFDLTEITLKLSLKKIEVVQESKDVKETVRVEEKKSEGIFVQSAKLDSLMEQAGNLIVLRNLLNDIIATHGSQGSISGKLKDIFQELDSISTTIHHEIGQMRKVPILSIFKPYHRFIRELATATGKKLVLQINDNKIMIDKDAGKYLSDSLIHLIRNSADHGIEDKELRFKVGKREEGIIAITALENLDGLKIIVADDGKGIDSKILVDKALKQGIITESRLKNMSEKEKLELIFCSGLSTAKSLTKISGRGEGMDIVKDALAKVKGSIHLSTELNKGTSFVIEIPHTKSVTVINSLIVLTNGNYFAMPTELVKKIIRLNDVHITHANSKRYIQDQDELLRLVDLSDFVDLSHFTEVNSSSEDLKKNQIAVVFSKDGRQFGFVVDDVVQQLQVVYKRFDNYIKNLPAFKGTTFLKDGRPCLVVDLDWVTDFLTDRVVT